jgi:hypothetical protein
MAVTLQDQKIMDQWGVVLEGAAGKDIPLLHMVQDSLQASGLPGVVWEKVDAQPSMLKGWFGNKRAYLMVTNDGLKDYRMYLGARDYGKHLDVSWFLTVEPGFFKSAFSAMLAHGNYQALSFNLDVFKSQDLRAYVTSVHRLCVRRAVEQIAKELGQDTSGFDWKSKGFLQVW